MGKNKFALKCFSDKIKKDHVSFFCFFMENRGIEDPPSKLNGKFHYYYFLNRPLPSQQKYNTIPSNTHIVSQA